MEGWTDEALDMLASEMSGFSEKPGSPSGPPDFSSAGFQAFAFAEEGGSKKVLCPQGTSLSGAGSPSGGRPSASFAPARRHHHGASGGRIGIAKQAKNKPSKIFISYLSPPRREPLQGPEAADWRAGWLRELPLQAEAVADLLLPPPSIEHPWTSATIARAASVRAGAVVGALVPLSAISVIFGFTDLARLLAFAPSLIARSFVEDVATKWTSKTILSAASDYAKLLAFRGTSFSCLAPFEAVPGFVTRRYMELRSARGVGKCGGSSVGPSIQPHLHAGQSRL